jgi:inosose dehydratase
MYADRIVELHLRQSHNGIWSEVFEKGDIDYSRLAKMLGEKGIIPHIVLEQAIETGTPHTMNTVEAMSKSLKNVKEIFS